MGYTSSQRQSRNSSFWFEVSDISSDVERRTIRSGVLVASAQIFKTGISIATVITLSRMLQPEAFGVVSAAAPLIAFMGILQNMGLGSATVYSGDLTAEGASGLFWANVTISCALAVVLLFSGQSVADFFEEPRLKAIVWIMSAGLVLTGLAVQHLALLRRRMLFRRVIAIELAAAMVGFAVAFVLAFSGTGYWALVGMNISVPLITVVGAWLCCSWRPAGFGYGSGVGRLLGFGGQLTIGQMMDFIRTNADKVIIAKLHGMAALGLYDRAYRLLLFPVLQIGIPITSVMLPALCRVQDRPELFRSLFQKGLSLSLFLTLPVSSIAVFNAKFIITFLLGERWISAVDIFRYLGLATLTLPVSFFCGLLYVASGKGKQIVVWSTVLCLSTVLAYTVSAPHGVVTMALAYAITVIALTPVQVALSVSRTAVTQPDVYLPYVKLLIAALVAGAGARITGNLIAHEMPQVGTFLVIVFTFVAVYGFVSLRVFGFQNLFKNLFLILRSDNPLPE